MKTYKANGFFKTVLHWSTRATGFCLFLWLSGCHLTDGETPGAATNGVKPKSMAIISERESHQLSTERDSLFHCPENQFMTGRHHFQDENHPTWYFCSKGFQFQPITIVNKTWTPLVPEDDTDYVRCAANQVVTGREHRDDEGGKSRLECGTPMGYAGPMQVTPEVPWIHFDEEYDSRFDCPENRVMVGRYHYGDEHGTTKYLCATLW